jgi:hypothetical protein
MEGPTGLLGEVYGREGVMGAREGGKEVCILGSISKRILG